MEQLKSSEKIQTEFEWSSQISSQCKHANHLNNVKWLETNRRYKYKNKRLTNSFSDKKFENKNIENIE